MVKRHSPAGPRCGAYWVEMHRGAELSDVSFDVDFGGDEGQRGTLGATEFTGVELSVPATGDGRQHDLRVLR